ncbi:hypothetical protein BDN71DRAFT_1430620 [Pleurotus eryngii]|uniref:HNH nuclease domain-containing protein n=1 Tax=Pleurotus eryngii TaxID=5323 RepID=A0A9P6A290_PLEER|nr:hypothetical protein BDN71DRAFT_1430620 [Pleurotus eryngii]
MYNSSEGKLLHPHKPKNDFANLSVKISEHLHWTFAVIHYVARVHSVCPHGAFCLLENHATANGVEYAHLVARALSSNNKLMNKLEWYWGMTRRTLNLDTCYNVFPCSSGLHASHDASEWGLLPSDDIVMQYHDSLTKLHSHFLAERTDFHKIPNGHFLYRFLPLRNMEIATITRYLHIPTAEDPSLRPEDLVNYFFPFNSIPPLKSHIHPKFAIFELGLQVSHLPLDEYCSLLITTPILSSVLDIYYAWTRTPPTRFLEDSVQPAVTLSGSKCPGYDKTICGWSQYTGSLYRSKDKNKFYPTGWRDSFSKNDWS